MSDHFLSKPLLLKRLFPKHQFSKREKSKASRSHGAPIYFFLAFIAMSGLSYINFLPSVVNALAGEIGYSDVEAGQIVALNGYGGLLGSSIAIMLVRRISWRFSMFVFLAVLAVIDVSTVWVEGYHLMLGWRFLGGLFGGLSLGVAFSVLARLDSPDRAFGTLLFVQFSVGSLVIYALPELEKILSTHAVFYLMTSFALISMILLLSLPAISLNSAPVQLRMKLSAKRRNVLLLLTAIISYQIAASAIWVYVGLIGQAASISAEEVSFYIAVTGLLGLLGAMLPAFSGNRFGRLNWVAAGVTLSMISAVLLNYSDSVVLYITAMSLLFFSWPAVQSYLLAVTADMDSSGQLSTIAAVVSSIGLATGPLLASSLLNNGSFSVMLYTCVATFLLSFVCLYNPLRTTERTRPATLSSQP
ncbi:MFS transporter [Vibrio penaeicida]|uniref:MFS transporter n=1 Tax=Vibrio penaeicida TaxID=104609 RepID=UPI000CE9ED22|nr:MFS transporter [Vibrio penaeicida]